MNFFNECERLNINIEVKISDDTFYNINLIQLKDLKLFETLERNIKYDVIKKNKKDIIYFIVSHAYFLIDNNKIWVIDTLDDRNVDRLLELSKIFINKYFNNTPISNSESFLTKTCKDIYQKYSLFYNQYAS